MNKSYELLIAPLDCKDELFEKIATTKTFKRKRDLIKYHDSLNIGSHSYIIRRIR